MKCTVLFSLVVIFLSSGLGYAQPGATRNQPGAAQPGAAPPPFQPPGQQPQQQQQQQQNMVIYRWIDDKGIIHITSEKPSWWKDEFDNADDWRTIKPDAPEPAASEKSDEAGARGEAEATEPESSGGPREISTERPAGSAGPNKKTASALTQPAGESGGNGEPAKGEPKQAFAKVNDAQKTGADENEFSFIGNTRTKIFHKANCRLIYRRENQDKYLIPSSLRIYFRSREEAVSRGYKPCIICNP